MLPTAVKWNRYLYFLNPVRTLSLRFQQIESIQRFNFEQHTRKRDQRNDILSQQDEEGTVVHDLLCRICERYATSSTNFRLVDKVVRDFTFFVRLFPRRYFLLRLIITLIMSIAIVLFSYHPSSIMLLLIRNCEKGLNFFTERNSE